MKRCLRCSFVWSIGLGLVLSAGPIAAVAADITLNAAMRNLSRLDARLSWDIERLRWIGGARWSLVGLREQVAPAGYTRTEVLLHPLGQPDRIWIGFQAPGVAFGPLLPQGQIARLLNPGAGGAGAPVHGAPTLLRLDGSLYPTGSMGAWVGAQGTQRLLGLLPADVAVGVWSITREAEYILNGVNAAVDLPYRGWTITPWTLLAQAHFLRAPITPADPWRSPIPLSRSDQVIYHAAGVLLQPWPRTRLQLEGWLARPAGEQPAGAGSVHLSSAWARRTIAVWGWIASPAYRPPQRQAVVGAALLALHATAATPRRRLETAIDLRWWRPVETSRRVAPPRLDGDARVRWNLPLALSPQAIVAVRFREYPDQIGLSSVLRARWESLTGGFEVGIDRLNGRMEHRLGVNLAARTGVVTMELAASNRWKERQSDWRETLDLRAVVRFDGARRWYLTVAAALNDLDRYDPDWTAVRESLLGTSAARATVTATVHARLLGATRM